MQKLLLKNTGVFFQKRISNMEKYQKQFKEEMNPRDEKLLDKMIDSKGLWDILDSLILLCAESSTFLRFMISSGVILVPVVFVIYFAKGLCLIP